MRRIPVIVMALALVLSGAATARADHIPGGRKLHKIVFQVNVDDPNTWNLTLNNIYNVVNELGKENVDVKLVTYGPGINMFRKSKSTVLARLDSLKRANGDALDYTVCSNTLQAMGVAKNDIADFVRDLYPGIVRIVELQEQGYVYIRP